MFRVVVELEPRGGLKREYDIGTYDDLPAARTALDTWLDPYGLRCYQTDDLWLSITKFIVCYVIGNPAYQAIAFIHIQGE